jgi:hypothetical protein
MLVTYRVYQNVAAIDPLVLGRVGQKRGTSSGKVREVKTGTRQVVLGLSDVHPETLKIVCMQLVVGSDLREDLLFYRCRSKLIVSDSISIIRFMILYAEYAHLDSIQHTGVEHVDTSVDSVADEFDGLLHETINDR